MPDLNRHVARRLRVHGRVQGVFFRASTRRVAQREGVTGWVRNDPDGTVAAHVEGLPAAVAAVEGWIRAGGPRHAVVQRIEAEDAPVEGHEGFTIHHGS